MDIFEKLNTNLGPLGKHSELSEGYFMFPKLEGEIAPRMKFKGKEVLNWSLNNYLGLGNDPEVRQADADAATKWGAAYPMGARMMSGNTDLHEQLESELAQFVGKEKAYLLNYGYQGIMSVIDSLIDRKDVIVYDSECHACIIDALRMHIGKRFVYPHNDIESCEKQLKRAEKLSKETGGGILVITEGVFGMTGDMGKLKEIVKLKEKFQFRLLVDDAHGFGTMGKTGAGTCEEQGVQQEVDLYFSTFAKSMASIGAFIAGDAKVIHYLKYNMRSQIFAKALPLIMVEGALKRLDLIRSRPEYKNNLWKIVNALQNGLKEKGFSIGTTNSPVTPVVLNGTVGEAATLSKDLRENYNIFCSVVIYPVVPKGMIILRLIPTAVHSIADVEETIAAFEAIKEKLSSGYYKTTELATSFGE
ncbi:aminotransferase class I/II-fold pyridoxal phosphate-dependent enzyme [Cyclobacterium marinum]|uniref:Aminotransferase class I and II n=1 Tax=Cyclobacterium marinum (strain ATCC 25205 / DSM 745 / LMG 13164 / NCIMB 1802) TaxID=880070 RepID=G0IXR6_CYCMS|nr:aminotransferase class I/II-fold pyridoxal phosphate-dependent enzyme [Cyclobacterium marinum]AEL28063.1 aminotransferase class I and II [Cyclobacterium marinum DSM 745]MBI0397834.1 aminotransferase class I/II-fold pyridoxal phosphate-dependent enzyme [Cyclobacterium marinum]MBR9777095.1 aminotransferase class I/II-fold pyridoxal phosphate-dependent enzyme [Cytophagales bacterium]